MLNAKPGMNAREFWYGNADNSQQSETFQDYLKKRGSVFVSVTFANAKGELRTRVFNPASWNPKRLLGKYLPKNVDGQPMKPSKPYEEWGNVPYLCLEAYRNGDNPVRQFKLERVRSIRVDGTEYTF